MRRELLVPKLGLTMSEGVLVEWLVRPGEAFGADQSLFVIESEKAANEVGAEADGVLLEITAQAGETLPCGTVIGYWDDGRAGEAADAASVVVAAGKAVPDGQRVPVTPLARRLAAQQGVDLGGVTGSGPRGRIRARDVLLKVERNALSGRALEADNTQNPPPAVTDAAGAAAPVHGSLRAPSNLERTVAQRLTAAKQQVPHFYLAVEAEMSAVMALRGQLNAAQTRQRLTINHFVLAAVGRALQAMPEMNRVWTDEGILSLDSSDVGMAVNTDKGLLVPVLRGAGRQSLGDLVRQAGGLIGRAQAGRRGSADMHGGAITVSNAGMHDVTYMTSIINPG
mgnify:FL=1